MHRCRDEWESLPHTDGEPITQGGMKSGGDRFLSAHCPCRPCPTGTRRSGSHGHGASQRSNMSRSWVPRSCLRVRQSWRWHGDGIDGLIRHRSTDSSVWHVSFAVWRRMSKEGRSGWNRALGCGCGRTRDQGRAFIRRTRLHELPAIKHGSGRDERIGPRPEQPEMIREPAESILYQALRSRFRSRGDPTDTALGDMGNACTVMIRQWKPAGALLVGGTVSSGIP